MSNYSWKDMGFGLYPVTEISHYVLKLEDGVDIAMKVWLPCLMSDMEKKFPYFVSNDNKKWTQQLYNGTNENIDNDEKFPTIIEYLPYGKDTAMTLQRDHSRHTWFCSHGYIDMRIDLRGSGASGGVYFDEYDEQEILDCIEIIEWIALQPWSNQRVGMYGKSWGGFNGLQLAYKQPKALSAVISLYSTDNRFTDDAHYHGDTILGDQMLPWASTMFLLNARSKHPRYFEDLNAWKESWSKHLNIAGQSPLVTWLQHQHRLDPYWCHGSISQDPKKLKCPILVIGGHADGYTSAALRMAAMLNQHSRAIVGPWAHNWPDVSAAGPNIDYLNVCLKWWNCHLKNENISDVQTWPRLSLYIRDAMRPDEMIGSPAGKWVCLPNWDKMYEYFQQATNNSDNKIQTMLQYMYLGASMSIQFQPYTTQLPPVDLVPHALQGAGMGKWFFVEYGCPEDQNIANEHSQCWMTEKLENDLVIAGLGKMFVCVEAEISGNYALQVRICDQFPGGESTLISTGCQNLCTTDDGWGKKFPERQKKIICIDLKGVGQTIESGHQLLISISPTCFPVIYPTIDCKSLKVYPSESVLIFQTATDEMLKNTTEFAPPMPLLQLPVVMKTDGSFSSSKCNSKGNYLFEITDKSGLISFPSMSYEYEENSVEKYKTNERVSFGVINAKISSMSSFVLDNGEKVKTLVTTFQEMKGDKNHFSVKEHLKVEIDDEEFFEKQWDNVIPRKYV